MPQIATNHRNRASEDGYRSSRVPQFAWIRFVCEPMLRRQLVRIADRDQVSLSEVVRRACRAYVEEQK